MKKKIENVDWVMYYMSVHIILCMRRDQKLLKLNLYLYFQVLVFIF